MATATATTQTRQHEARDLAGIVASLSGAKASSRETLQSVIHTHNRAYQHYESQWGLVRHMHSQGHVCQPMEAELERLEKLANRALDRLLTYTPKSPDEFVLIAAYVVTHWKETDPTGGDWMASALVQCWASKAVSIPRA